MKTTPNPYSGCRYPAEIISHAVWLHLRFTLSFRDVEENLAARGIVVSYEVARQMRRFKSQGHAKWFPIAHGPINNLFRVGRHLLKAKHYRFFRDRAFDVWSEVTCAQKSA